MWPDTEPEYPGPQVLKSISFTFSHLPYGCRHYLLILSHKVINLKRLHFTTQKSSECCHQLLVIGFWAYCCLQWQQFIGRLSKPLFHSSINSLLSGSVQHVFTGNRKLPIDNRHFQLASGSLWLLGNATLDENWGKHFKNASYPLIARSWGTCEHNYHRTYGLTNRTVSGFSWSMTSTCECQTSARL